MTKEEAIKSLLNTKVYTDGHSKEIQTKLFDLGFSWLSEETVCQYFDNPFLYISEDKTITRASNMVTFKEEDGYKEIPATYILSLKWEESQFKDGDILVASDGISDKTIIFKNIPYNGCVNYHALHYEVLSSLIEIDNHCNFLSLRYATASENQQLFDALSKEGYRWNPDKKQIEKLHTFKPFDKVLVCDGYDNAWINDFFSYEKCSDSNIYYCVGGVYYKCIPYEGNENLVGKPYNGEDKL